jgi:glycosyltransferase involved in cell wall biosynthesis
MSVAARVLYLIDGLGLSGKSKAMVDLIGGLDPARYRPAAVVAFDAEESPLAARLAALRVPVEFVPCRDGLNVDVMLRLGAVVRRLRPDVLHCYNPRTMLYGGLVARALRVPGTLGTLSAFACLTPDGEYRFLPQKLASASRSNRIRNRVASGLVRTIVTVSPSLGRGFCRFNRVDPERLRIVPYGVDLTRFSVVSTEEITGFRTRHRLPAGAVVIGSVGRLVEQKDYPTQLRAFALAAKTRPALHMLLVGDGPLRAELTALAGELGIAERVTFAGHCEDVPAALRAMDVYVLASKFEPYGVAVLEAKAAGAAIVATRVNELPEILGEHEGAPTGRIVPPEDPAAMAEAFGALADDAEGRRALGARAMRDAAIRHGLESAISAYQDIYDGVRQPGVREVGAAAAF